MSLAKRIVLIWIGFISAGVVLLALFPDREIWTVETAAINLMRLLIGLVTLYVFRTEPNSSNRAVFLNFSLFCFVPVLSFLSGFVGVGGSLFTEERYAAHYAFVYLYSLDFLLLAFCIVYVVLDSLFGNFKTYQKYAFAILVVGGTFAYYYHPFFQNAKYLYSTEEIADYRTVRDARDALLTQGKENPSVQEIASLSSLGVWRDGRQVGLLFEDQKLLRVAELLPYLEGDNYNVLLLKPLHMNTIYMNVMCVVFIFLFFGYQYKNDPPQGAYIEKIIFLFLPYCSLEILHHYSYIKSVQLSTYTDILQVGQYLSLANLMLIFVFFVLRLRFITSVKGEFYERELVSDAEHISRWRDALDNLIVRHFLNPQAIHGRLFAPRTAGTETKPVSENHA